MIEEFGKVIKDASLKEYSTIGIGGKCKYLVKVKSEGDLSKLITFLNEKNIKYIVLGNLSNVIIDSTPFDGVVIKLDYLDDIKIEDNTVTAGAGIMLPKLVSVLIQNGYPSLAFAAMIPGCVGGSVVGNAGCYGYELMQFVKSVRVMDKDGSIYEINKDDISYGYRYTSLKGKYIVLSVTFIIKKEDVSEAKKWILEINQKRIESQPIDKKSVGSIFRNPEGYSSGKLIDELGLKGYSIGGAKVSEKHANFIINEKNATFDDVINLINLIKSKVKDEYDIDLIVEPSIIRWDEI